MAEVCEECINYKTFGKQCWYYWEGKKTCSQHRKGYDQDTKVKNSESELLVIH